MVTSWTVSYISVNISLTITTGTTTVTAITLQRQHSFFNVFMVSVRWMTIVSVGWELWWPASTYRCSQSLLLYLMHYATSPSQRPSSFITHAHSHSHYLFLLLHSFHTQSVHFSREIYEKWTNFKSIQHHHRRYRFGFLSYSLSLV